jgi:predicted RNase H-like HicB family nuclease
MKNLLVKSSNVLTKYIGGIKMLIDYINKAMSKAIYDKLEDGSFSGKIPQCPGVIAFGETLYKCQQELKSSLEGWLIVKIRHGDKLPILGRINLNKKMPLPKEAVAHG